MCFWVEVYTYMFFVLHNYYDINIIFFVFVCLERKVSAIPQLPPIWGPFQHLRPFSFNIWDVIGNLRPFSAFDTLLADSAAHTFVIIHE